MVSLLSKYLHLTGIGLPNPISVTNINNIVYQACLSISNISAGSGFICLEMKEGYYRDKFAQTKNGCRKNLQPFHSQNCNCLGDQPADEFLK